MEKTKVFTAENLERLKGLYSDLSFEGLVLAGKFGANELNPFELLNQTTVNTLRTLRQGVRGEIAKMEGQDEWSMPAGLGAKLDKFKVWDEFLNLLVGYRLNKELEASREGERRKLRAEIERLRDENKTPAERLAEMEAKLAAL